MLAELVSTVASERVSTVTDSEIPAGWIHQVQIDLLTNDKLFSLALAKKP